MTAPLVKSILTRALTIEDDSPKVRAEAALITVAAASASAALPVDGNGAPAAVCLLSATTACYVRLNLVGDNTAASAAHHHLLLQPGIPFPVCTQDIDTIKAIRVTADGVLSIAPME